MEFEVKYNLEDYTNNIAQEDNGHAWDMVPQVLCVCGRVPEYRHDDVLCVQDAVVYGVPETCVALTNGIHTERVDGDEKHEIKEAYPSVMKVHLVTCYHQCDSDYTMNDNYRQ